MPLRWDASKRAYTSQNIPDNDPDPWPSRDYYQSDQDYAIDLLKQLFVELARLQGTVTEIKSRLEPPKAPVGEVVDFPSDIGDPDRVDPDLKSYSR